MSALIFVAVAVAWAVYLVPKALRHHEEYAASRTVEQISDRVRVLARRDAVTSRATRLVTADKPAVESPIASEETPVVADATPAVAAEVEVEVEHTVSRVTETGGARPASPRPAQRAAARRAAQRRRRVLLTLLFALTVTVAAVVGGYLAPAWIGLPAGLVVAWLVLCRVMVRAERARRRTAPAARRTASEVVTATVDEDDDATGEIEAIAEEIADEVVEAAAAVNGPEGPQPGTWAPVPVTLPTYVAKAQASRTVRTIDLDSTGVWSSGRNADDSELAREADEQDRTARAAQAEATPEQRRASGS